MFRHLFRQACLAVSALWLSFGTNQLAMAEDAFKSPDVLVLGDLQLGLGAGAAFIEFLKKLFATFKLIVNKVFFCTYYCTKNLGCFKEFF